MTSLKIDMLGQNQSSHNQEIFSFPIVIATWFGVGYMPIAPGTWGSLAAMPFAWLIVMLGGQNLLFVFILGTFVLGWWASEAYIRRVGGKDPKAVVIDEVVGQWLTLSVITPDIIMYGLGFLVFRIFDIFKPWPIGLADHRINGGIGIMVDDVLAGIYAALSLYLINKFMAEGITI